MTIKELTKLVEELKETIEQIKKDDYGINKTLYSIEEVAAIFGVTKEAIYKQIRNGDIPAVKLGTLKVRGSDLKQLLGINA